MRRLFILLVFCTLICSCLNSGSDRIKINVDKASRTKTSISELCSKVELISLGDSEFDGPSIGETILMDMTDNRYFLLSQDKSEIGVFDRKGRYISSIESSGKIIDISTFQNKYLDVLERGRIVEYELEDFSIHKTFFLPEGELEYKSVMRRDENVFLISSISNGRAYNCYYVIDLTGLSIKDHFYSLENPLATANDYVNSRFFRYNDSSYFSFSQSGDIYIFTNDDYVFPRYRWDWGEYASSIAFTNAQKTKDKLYLRFNLNEMENTLIYNTKEEKYKVVRLTKEGTSFPIGVIRDGVNYYFTHSSELSKYLIFNSKDVEVVGDIDGIGEDDSLVLIKYYL